MTYVVSYGVPPTSVHVTRTRYSYSNTILFSTVRIKCRSPQLQSDKRRRNQVQGKNGAEEQEKRIPVIAMRVIPVSGDWEQTAVKPWHRAGRHLGRSPILLGSLATWQRG